MRGASPFPPAGRGRPAQLPGPCPAAGSLLGRQVPAQPLAGDGEANQEGRSWLSAASAPRPHAVLCVCASLFSSLWLIKYLGSLSCSPVSAFRFGFPDFSWGFFWGGPSSVSLSPPVGLAGGTPPRERFRPRQPGYFAGFFLSPVAFLAEHPRSCVEVGPGLPVSLHVLTKTPALSCVRPGRLCGPGGGRPVPRCSGCWQALGRVSNAHGGLSRGPPPLGASTCATAIHRRALARLFGD